MKHAISTSLTKVSAKSPGIVESGLYAVTIVCGSKGLSFDSCILLQLRKCKSKLELCATLVRMQSGMCHNHLLICSH